MKERRRKGPLLMYLAYVDDSGVTDVRYQYAVYAAVLIAEDDFREYEKYAGTIIEGLVPPERWDSFQEFHARELFRGEPPFDGIPEDRRLRAIDDLMTIYVDKVRFPVIYAAVDRAALPKKRAKSLDLATAAFRHVLIGIEAWLAANQNDQLFFLTVDDTDDEGLKAALRKTFRALRKQDRPPNRGIGQLQHAHDAPLFGDSKEMFGLQLADLCAYFTGVHLHGGDAKAEEYYKIFESAIEFSEIVALPEERG